MFDLSRDRTGKVSQPFLITLQALAPPAPERLIDARDPVRPCPCRDRRTAAVPAYARSALSGGIVHFGVGNFHRAHQAVYLDALFNQGRDHDWALVGAGVRAADGTMRQKLLAQDWLTTVVEQEAGSRARRGSPGR